ncbi:hypothetical protein VOLCADRAFT_103178 [Volvox carteri f. nagariensis]|uniref:Carbohydrate kinase PfkB domain-containing protein n=1 Tax=Volvox carteri f. nagariensis TaxID=3068 RepID=D8TJZ3_VOLCA|nr:uncharacterized protein VOLCADRAFT_103178 [Volvox carteri f. nagariensis]EFJ51973.1 hypothetical protein VOLCADRAFT_103178 [Volvox carteri f. nagariensis]|eukprot:XP_002946747.1 hypothetical protein VOLCADRAFT_103178 [Volvox carteri f. nagariensis]
MRAHCRCAETASTSPRCAVPAPNRILRRVTAQRGCTKQLMCIHPRLNSINAAAAVPIQQPGTQPTSFGPRPDLTSGFQSDILGLGQAIVDLSSSVSDDVLFQFNVPKGGRRVITVDERASIMETLDDVGAPSQVSAGGSLANTLVGIAKLSRAAAKDVRVLLGGSLGTDTLGQFFNSQMKRAGVRCLLETQQHHYHHHHHPHSPYREDPEELRHQHQQDSEAAAAPAIASSNGHTGTVMVLTTPDAQRSFLSFFTSESLVLSERIRTAVRASRMVVVEGYLWEMPGAEEYIRQVQDLAHAAGAQVAMTAGDPGVVSRHREAMLRVLSHGVDLLFTNEDEASALVGLQAEQGSGSSSSEEAVVSNGARVAAALAELCPMVVVTAGSKGSYIGAMGEIHAVPPYWLPQGPVDTCGAGDAYAAGWLYALLTGYDIRTAGEFASRVASAVIGQYGPHLSDDDAELLVRELPEHHLGAPLRAKLGGSMDLGAGGFADF